MNVSNSTHDSCTICNEPYDESIGHGLYPLNCSHAFGRSCLIKWAETKSSCPFCRANTVPVELSQRISDRYIVESSLFPITNLMNSRFNSTLHDPNRLANPNIDETSLLPAIYPTSSPLVNHPIQPIFDSVAQFSGTTSRPYYLLPIKFGFLIGTRLAGPLGVALGLFAAGCYCASTAFKRF